MIHKSSGNRIFLGYPAEDTISVDLYTLYIVIDHRSTTYEYENSWKEIVNRVILFKMRVNAACDEKNAVGRPNHRFLLKGKSGGIRVGDC